MAKHSFFKELKRRNVYKVAIAYLATSWIIAQLASIVLPSFEAPSWAMRVVLVLLLIGFPIALIIGWLFEMSPQGLVKTPSKTLNQNSNSSGKKYTMTSNLFIGTLLFIIVVQFAYFNIFREQDSVFGFIKSIDEEMHSALKDKKVAILVFENQTSRDELEHYGVMISDWITPALMETEKVNVVSAANVRNNIQHASVGNMVSPKFAELTGADILVQGRYYLEEDQLIVVANIIDAVSGEVVFANLKEVGSVDNKMEILNLLTDRILGYWVLSKYKRFEKKAPKYEAYKAFIEAEDIWFNKDENKAEQLLKKSFELDSSFYTPVLKMIVLYRNQAKYFQADSLIKEIREKNPPLTTWEEWRFEALQAINIGDYKQAAFYYDKMHKLDSSDKISYNMAIENYISSNQPKKAVEFIESFANESKGDRSLRVRDWRSAVAYFSVEDYFNTCTSAIESQKHSKSLIPSILHIKALVRLDSIAQLDYYLQKYESEIGGNMIPWLWWNLCFEMKWADNKELLQKYAKQYLSIAEKYSESPDYELMVGFSYFYQEKYSQALDYLIESRISERMRNTDFGIISLRAVCHAYLGNEKQAREVIEIIETLDLSFDNGKRYYYKAHIEAALGLQEQAVSSLRKAKNLGTGFSFWRYKNDILLMPLFGYPPFEELVQPIE